MKEKNIFALNAEKKINEDNFNNKYQELQKNFDEKIAESKDWEEKYYKVEKELKVKNKY